MFRMPRASALARPLLACFALAVALASAAPLLRPAQAMERLCTASGRVVWLPSVDNEGAAQAAGGVHTLDCALCLPLLAAPPAGALAGGPAPRPALVAPVVRRARHTPPLSRAAFPPRAPPGRAASAPFLA